MRIIWRIILQLGTPLKYLRVRHPAKFQYDLTIPLIVALFCTLILHFAPIDIAVFGKAGIVSIGNNLLQILTGFYIAALAAVATFPSEMIEKEFDGESMILIEKVNGVAEKSELNRRRFLSLLFGYLAFLSLVLYVMGSVSNVVADELAAIIPVAFHESIKLVYGFIYILLSANLVTSTLLGLHYLAYKLHMPTRNHV